MTEKKPKMLSINCDVEFDTKEQAEAFIKKYQNSPNELKLFVGNKELDAKVESLEAISITVNDK